MKRRTGPELPGAQPPGAAPVVRAAVGALPASDAGRAHWGSLHGAWQKATDSRDAAPGKEPLPAPVLIAIAGHRAWSVRELRDALEHDPTLRLRIDALRPHARDAQGRNWNVPVLAGGTPPRASHEADFRRVVDALRDQFDLA